MLTKGLPGLAERDLPDSMDMTDAELARKETEQLRATLQEIQKNQNNAYTRLQNEQTQVAQAQAVSASYAQAVQTASAAENLVPQMSPRTTSPPSIPTPEDFHRLYGHDEFSPIRPPHAAIIKRIH